MRKNSKFEKLITNHSTYLLEGQESERLIFRKLNDSDFDAWLEFCKSDDAVKYLGFLDSLKDPEKRCRAWFNRVYERYTLGTGGMNALIDKSTGRLIGQCGLQRHEIDGVEEWEVGYSIIPAHQRRGYAVEAAQKCRDFAFDNNLCMTLISLINVDNIESKKVATKSGMTLDQTIMFNGAPLDLFRISKYKID